MMICRDSSQLRLLIALVLATGGLLMAFVLVIRGPDGAVARGGSTPDCNGNLATHIAEPGVPTRGTDGEDSIVGTHGRDVIRGGKGEDQICGLKGDDRLSGGRKHDSMFGGPGNDEISGGKRAGDFLVGGFGRDRIQGGTSSDYLNGGMGDDMLLGLAGGDFLNGQEGDDAIVSGRGIDRLSGGPGNDFLDGGRGWDVCRSGDGHDQKAGCPPKGEAGEVERRRLFYRGKLEGSPDQTMELEVLQFDLPRKQPRNIRVTFKARKVIQACDDGTSESSFVVAGGTFDSRMRFSGAYYTDLSRGGEIYSADIFRGSATPSKATGFLTARTSYLDPQESKVCRSGQLRWRARAVGRNEIEQAP